MRIRLIILTFFGTILFSSCKKDYHCNCPSDPPSEDKDIILIHDTKKNFEDKCSDMQNPNGNGPCIIPK